MTAIKEKSRISIRTETKLKDKTTKELSSVQLDLTTTFNLFLTKLSNKINSLLKLQMKLQKKKI